MSTATDIEKYRRFVEYLVLLIMEKATETKQLKAQVDSASGTEYLDGQLYGYYRVITFMQLEAEAHGIPLHDVGLDRINPDKDLI